ncbi:MAG: serine/threonine protein kinase [Acidobacteriota bacterium]
MAELKLANSIVDERYAVDRCLGRGSYAEIFLAYDKQFDDAPVIIKALNSSLQGTPDTDLERTLVENFQNEANALDKVRHPHIIRRLGHGTAIDLGGKLFHYLVLEYMPGGDLMSLCKKRPLSLNEVMLYFEQVAEALAYAHSQQVIHRDIKPKNLLLSTDHQTLKICDFGVAKMTGQNVDDEITRVGTDVYAPPEHHPEDDGEACDEKLTPSADVYSLAKTIYTAMCGRAPRGFSRRPISSLPTELVMQRWGGALLRVLNKATATRVADRYATVNEFWEDFAAINNLLPEEDEEKTHVSSRLQGTSDVERPSTVPNFQNPATASKRLPKQARIVVDLPTRKQDSGFRIQDSGNQTSQNVTVSQIATEQAATVTATPANNAMQNHFVQQGAVAQRNVDAVRTRKLQTDTKLERNVFDKMRSKVKPNYLRWAFIVFLLLAVGGFVSSVYLYFSNQPSLISWIDKDGEILGAEFVKLRADATTKGKTLRWLPRGTRIRKMGEERDGWVRVKVTYVPPTPLPVDAPTDNLSVDTGWINSRLIDF